MSVIDDIKDAAKRAQIHIAREEFMAMLARMLTRNVNFGFAMVAVCYCVGETITKVTATEPDDRADLIDRCIKALNHDHDQD